MERKQVGTKSGRISRGTKIPDRTWRRYSEGETPTRSLNRALKLPTLENPTSKQASVTLCPPPASNALARPIRRRVRNSCGVSPKACRWTRRKW